MAFSYSIETKPIALLLKNNFLHLLEKYEESVFTENGQHFLRGIVISQKKIEPEKTTYYPLAGEYLFIPQQNLQLLNSIEDRPENFVSRMNLAEIINTKAIERVIIFNP